MLSVLALRRVLYASRSRCFSTRALVGFIGIGKMGKNLVRSPTVPHVRSQLLSVQAANLLSGGFDVLAYDSSASALSEVTALGARTASSAAAVAQQTNTIITMLPNDAILDSVVNELVAHFKGGLHISCSTVAPSTSRRMAQLHNKHSSSFVAAPVFARPDGVAAKKALFALSGERLDLEHAKALLCTSASGIHEFGSDPGAANVVKLCGNYMIAAAIEAIAEACALGEANNVDRVQLMQLLSSTIFDCLIYKGYGQRVSERDFKPGGFSLALGLKDVCLVQSTARDSGVPMPMLSVLVDRFVAAKAKGRMQMDWSAVALNSAEDAGVDVSEDLQRNAHLCEEAAAHLVQSNPKASP